MKYFITWLIFCTLLVYVIGNRLEIHNINKRLDLIDVKIESISDCLLNHKLAIENVEGMTWEMRKISIYNYIVIKSYFDKDELEKLLNIKGLK